MSSQVFNPIHCEGEWGKKRPPTSFSSKTSANVIVSLQTFLAFSFNPFSTLV